MTLGANLERDRLTRRARRVKTVIAAFRRQADGQRAEAHAGSPNLHQAIAQFEAELPANHARLSDHGSQPAAGHVHRPERGSVGSMEIEAFIDFICPRCYIAVRHLSDALAMFEHRDDVRIVWRSFQLDVISGRSFDEVLVGSVMRNHRMNRADATAVAETVHMKLREAAARAGLAYDPGMTTPGDTFAAHRILQLAAARGVADLAVERIQRAYFEQGMAIDNRESLSLLAAEIGIDPDTARSVAFSDAYADAVFDDRDRAESRGIWSVPFFICADEFVVSGTASPRWMHEIMKRCWDVRYRESW